MKKTLFIVAVFALFLVPFHSRAGADSAVTQYRKHLDQKIDQCERKTLLVSSRGENLREAGNKACDQAIYYRLHRDEIVEEMVRLNVGTEGHEIDHFLIRYYSARHPSASVVETAENF